MKLPSKQLRLIKHLLSTAKHLKQLELPRNLHQINLKVIVKLNKLIKSKLEIKINSIPLGFRWPRSLQSTSVQLTRNNTFSPGSILKSFILIANLIKLPNIKYLFLDLFSTKLSLDMEPIFAIFAKIGQTTIPKWWVRIKSNTSQAQNLMVSEQVLSFLLQADCLLLWSDISLLSGGVSHLAQHKKTLCLNYQYNPQLVKLILLQNTSLQKIYLSDITGDLSHLDGIKFPKTLQYLDVRLNEKNAKAVDLFKFMTQALSEIEALHTLKFQFVEVPHGEAEIELSLLFDVPCLQHLKKFSLKLAPYKLRYYYFNTNLATEATFQVIAKGLNIFQNLETLKLDLACEDLSFLPYLEKTMENISPFIKNLKIKVQTQGKFLDDPRLTRKEISFALPFERLDGLEKLYIRFPGVFTNQSFYKMTSGIQNLTKLQTLIHESSMFGDLSRRQLQELVPQLPKLYKTTERANNVLPSRSYMETYYIHSA